jgi:hypothetical protein
MINDMENRPRAFDDLSEDDQKAAIDVAVAKVLIDARIPSTGTLHDNYIVTEFAGCRTLPPNKIKYALRSIGQSLLKSDWKMTIEKQHGRLVTTFVLIPGDTDESVQKPEPIH